MAEEVYGFDYERATRLKAIADHPRVVNQLNLARRRTSSGGAVRYCYPPAGGIPAATFNSTTKELFPARALCTVAIKDAINGSIKPSTIATETIEVENQVTSIVGVTGKPMTVAYNETSGYWEVIVEDCNGSPSSGTGSVSINGSVTKSSVDPISSGTSSQLDMSY